ncbi:MAG: hypothetical protein AAGA53_04660 [Pseudomonadota bacterium]
MTNSHGLVFLVYVEEYRLHSSTNCVQVQRRQYTATYLLQLFDKKWENRPNRLINEQLDGSVPLARKGNLLAGTQANETVKRH